MPVYFRRGFDFENRDFYRILKIEDNFKCQFYACYGLFSPSTFGVKRNWPSVIGTLRSDVLMFRIPGISQCVNNYFETEKS